MEKVTFKQIFENIYKFEWNPSLTHLPGWWNIIYNSINAKGNLDPEDPVIQPWLSFSKVMSKVITYWQKKSKKLDGHSLTTLLEKLSTIPGDILATSFSSEDAESLTNLWKSYAYMEDPEETECLDSVSNPTTSTSSTTVLTVDEIADALSKKKLNLLESLDQIVNTTSQSINLPEQTGTMSSSISFLQNGELATYGLEEKVGKYRLTINWYDGKKSITAGEKWWEGSKIAGATLTVNDKMVKELVEQLLAQVTIRFMAKNPVKKENIRTSNNKRKRY